METLPTPETWNAYGPVWLTVGTLLTAFIAITTYILMKHLPKQTEQFSATLKDIAVTHKEEAAESRGDFLACLRDTQARGERNQERLEDKLAKHFDALGNKLDGLDKGIRDVREDVQAVWHEVNHKPQPRPNSNPKGT